MTLHKDIDKDRKTIRFYQKLRFVNSTTLSQETTNTLHCMTITMWKLFRYPYYNTLCNAIPQKGFANFTVSPVSTFLTHDNKQKRQKSFLILHNFTTILLFYNKTLSLAIYYRYFYDDDDDDDDDDDGPTKNTSFSYFVYYIITIKSSTT